MLTGKVIKIDHLESGESNTYFVHKNVKLRWGTVNVVEHKEYYERETYSGDTIRYYKNNSTSVTAHNVVTGEVKTLKGIKFTVSTNKNICPMTKLATGCLDDCKTCVMYEFKSEESTEATDFEIIETK